MSKFLKTVHNKFFHKKEQSVPPQNVIQIPEQVVAKMDYNELVNAIVEANRIIEKEKEEKEEIEKAEQRTRWQKALMGEKYEEKEKPNDWKTFSGLMFFKKEKATEDNAIFGLIQICNSVLLFIYEYSLYAITVFNFAKMFSCISNVLTHFSLYFSTQVSHSSLLCGEFGKISLCLFLIVFPLIIGRTIRVARLQLSNCKNKQFIFEVFNALITFTALVVAIITIIMTSNSCSC